MKLFPITHRLSCKIYESILPRGNWKQMNLKHDASNFFQKPDSWKLHPWMEKSHPWMKKCHPWMEECHQWMEKSHPWMEKCHPWIKVSSVDVIHGWRRRMMDMDAALMKIHEYKQTSECTLAFTKKLFMKEWSQSYWRNKINKRWVSITS